MAVLKSKMSYLKKNSKDGGLKAPNFAMQLISIRIMWVKRFLMDSAARWKFLSDAFFPLFDLRDIFMSRCDTEFLNINIPDFYKEILAAWKHFKMAFLPDNTFEIRKEVLWFNPVIKIHGKSIFYKHWYDKGILYIDDIVNENGEFLSHEEINIKNDLHVTFLDILSLRSAIPREWKDSLTKEITNVNSSSFKIIFVHHGLHIPINKLTAKDVYAILLEHKEVQVISQERWEESFNIEISKDKWEKIYCLPFKCTIESRLQAFQYKILHRFASHNYLLKKYKLSENENCTLCQSVETLEHKLLRM